MLPDWIQTDGGFWIDPRDARRTVAEVAALCWAARIRCMACGHAVRWSVAELEARFAGDVTLGAIARRRNRLTPLR